MKKKRPAVKKTTRRKPAAKKTASAVRGKHFSRKELLQFKKILLQRNEEIIDDIRTISEDTLKKSQKDASGDISGYTFHMADVATDTYDREFSLGLASSDREFLYELSDAIKRIDEGTYGVCEECECLIGKTRLRAVPHARLCVKCQEKRERR